jgi:protein-L-isoaspartate(D-aspartate) O-methyltransferase
VNEENKRRLEEQLVRPGRRIKNARVLEAMLNVPREAFVPPASQKDAYRDEPLPIGYGQTISQPFVVAFMTEQLDLQATDEVLEIGSGSGYQTAILALLVEQVYAIEILPPLAERARTALRRLGYNNVNLVTRDGYQGWPEERLFEAILVACAPDHIPPSLLRQLKDGGRMMIPVGKPGDQQLFLLRKRGAVIEEENVLPVRFLPMTRDQGSGL